MQEKTVMIGQITPAMEAAGERAYDACRSPYFRARMAEAFVAMLEAAPAVEQAQAVPVAYGIPNTMITGNKHALMQVELEIPSDDQYAGALWIPLYAHPAPLDSDTRKMSSDLCDMIIANKTHLLDISKVIMLREKLEAGNGN